MWESEEADSVGFESGGYARSRQGRRKANHLQDNEIPRRRLLGSVQNLRRCGKTALYTHTASSSVMSPYCGGGTIGKLQPMGAFIFSKNWIVALIPLNNVAPVSTKEN